LYDLPSNFKNNHWTCINSINLNTSNNKDVLIKINSYAKIYH
jgi:hypothetical protein